MPNSVTENFILGRQIALERRFRQQEAEQLRIAEEQRQIENERAKKADELAQKQEDRLAKQAEQELAVGEARLKLQKAEMKAGIQNEKGLGLVPFNREVEMPAQTLDTSQLTNIPQGQRAAIDKQLLSPPAEFGDFKFDIDSNLRQVLGEDIVTETPEKFAQLIEVSKRRQQLAVQAESQKSNVLAAKVRADAQVARDTYLEKKKQIEKEEDRKIKLQDDEDKRKQANIDFKDRAQYTAGLTVSRQIQAEERKRTNELKVLQETVGTSAGKALGIQYAAGQQRFNPSDAQFAAMAVQEVMPEILKAQGIEPKPGETYLPINLEQGQRIRDSSSIIPALQRVRNIANKLIEDGTISESLLQSMQNKTFEELKDVVGLSEIKKILEPLSADSIMLARKITNDRVTDRDAVAFAANLIGLGLDVPIMNGRIDELVSRTEDAIRRDTTMIPESQLRAFYPEVLDLGIYKSEGESDLDKAKRLGLVQ